MHNKRLKRDCQRVAFPVPLSRGGYGCCVWVWLLCVVSPLGGRYVNFVNNKEIGNGKFYCWEVDF